jgi:predicted nucleic acid-binding protein
MIFVDSGAWFATIVPSDQDYRVAKSWFDTNDDMLVTSNFIVDETLTLFRARGETRHAEHIGTLFFEGELAQIEYVTEDDFRKAWTIFRDYDDKGWSFTDCTSKVIMERLGIKTAFAFDQHFRQFGAVDVVP